jgi:hypothetical protein
MGGLPVSIVRADTRFSPVAHDRSAGKPIRILINYG